MIWCLWPQAESNSRLCYQSFANMTEVLPLKRCGRMSPTYRAPQLYNMLFVKHSPKPS